jgi:hypothetical protein
MNRIRPIIRQVLGIHEPFVDRVPMAGVVLVKSANHVPLECISRIVGEIGNDDFFLIFAPRLMALTNIFRKCGERLATLTPRLLAVRWASIM